MNDFRVEEKELLALLLIDLKCRCMSRRNLTFFSYLRVVRDLLRTSFVGLGMGKDFYDVGELGLVVGFVLRNSDDVGK